MEAIATSRTSRTTHGPPASRDRSAGVADSQEMRQRRHRAADGVAAQKAREGNETSLRGERRESMPGTNDRNDLSGEGAVRPGIAMVVLLLRRAPIAAVARSTGRYPPCNKMYHIEDYRQGRPVIERYRRRSSARVWSNCCGATHPPRAVRPGICHGRAYAPAGYHSRRR